MRLRMGMEYFEVGRVNTASLLDAQQDVSILSESNLSNVLMSFL